MKITHALLSLTCLFALSACPAQESSTQEGSTDQTTTTIETEVATTPAETDAAALPVGNAEAGPQVFIAKGCTACHVIKSLPEAVGAVGPALDGIGERAATRVAGLDAMGYLKQSIEDPEAYLVEGYQNMMVKGLNAQMSPQEYADLLAYMMSLKS